MNFLFRHTNSWPHSVTVTIEPGKVEVSAVTGNSTTLAIARTMVDAAQKKLKEELTRKL